MNIVNPIDNNQYSIFSKTGRTLLKLYLRNFKNGGTLYNYKKDVEETRQYLSKLIEEHRRLEKKQRKTEREQQELERITKEIDELYFSLETSGMMQENMNEINEREAIKRGIDPYPFADPTPACNDDGIWSCL